MNTPVRIAEDRSLLVPKDCIVKTGYVHVDRVKIACRARMSIGDLDRAYQKRLQLGENCSWPCPNGYWDGEDFVVQDGRHEFLAALMLGVEFLLVAWITPA